MSDKPSDKPSEKPTTLETLRAEVKELTTHVATFRNAEAECERQINELAPQLPPRDKPNEVTAKIAELNQRRKDSIKARRLATDKLSKASRLLAKAEEMFA